MICGVGYLQSRCVSYAADPNNSPNCPHLLRISITEKILKVVWFSYALLCFIAWFCALSFCLVESRLRILTCIRSKNRHVNKRPSRFALTWLIATDTVVLLARTQCHSSTWMWFWRERLERKDMRFEVTREARFEKRLRRGEKASLFSF